MNTSLRRRDVLTAAAAGTAAFTLPGFAQSAWPAKPVMMIVPFPAGGGTDAFARPLSAQFAKNTGKQLVIDNKGGAGGTVGASLAARAPNDGYAVFMGAVHHTIAPSMYPKLDYDLEKDFIPLTLVASVPQVVVVNPKNITAPDFKTFLDLLRKSPGRFNYGSAGTGTTYSTKRLIIDLLGKIEKVEKMGENDGNDIIKTTMRARYNGTAASAGRLIIVNLLTALP